MKKIAVTLLIMLLAIATVFANGASENVADVSEKDADAGKTTIRVAWWGNQLRNDRTQKAIDLYMEKNPDIKIEAEFTAWSNYWDRLATQAAGGELPDVIQMDYMYILQYVKSGQLASFDPFIEKGILKTDKIPASVMSSGTIDGGVYGLVLGSASPMMVFDQDTVDKAGAEISFNPTISEFYDFCQKVYDATGIPMFWESGMNMIKHIARANGEDIFTELLRGDDTSTREHFELVEKFAKAPFHISPELLAEKDTLSLDLMPINDLTTFNQFTISNGYNALTNACGGRKLGVCSYPKPDNSSREPMFVKPTMFFSISETSKVKEESAKFLDWFVNSVEANEILLGERGVPANADVSAAVSALVNPQDAVAFDYVTEVAPFASPLDPPDPSGFSEVEALLLTYVDGIRYGNISADQATAEFVPKAKQILEDARI